MVEIKTMLATITLIVLPLAGLLAIVLIVRQAARDKVLAAFTERIVRWIVENVDEMVMPDDKGNGNALVYNLVHLAREGAGYRRYAYEADQDEEIASGFVTIEAKGET